METLPVPTAEDIAPTHNPTYLLEVVANMPSLESEGDMATATELLGQVKQVTDEIEAKRKRLSTPLTRIARELNKAAGELAEPWVLANSRLRDLLSQYHLRTLEAKRFEEQAATEAGAARTAVLDPAESVQVAAGAKTESASSSFRSRWTHEVLDPDALIKAAAKSPELRRFLQVDGQAIREAIKKGERQIPGVRIFETADVVVR